MQRVDRPLTSDPAPGSVTQYACNALKSIYNQQNKMFSVSAYKILKQKQKHPKWTNKERTCL